jgi:hypothetical protein
MSDEGEASTESIRVARLVYRVSFHVPPSFRDPRARLQAPAGELQVDASLDRLRARLLGPGWPAVEGTEMRLRADLLGVYLFDEHGGRSLGAGQLAAWFEGRETEAAQARVAVRREYGARDEGPVPGELLCALLAEWGNQDREALAPRCKGSLPPAFRVGPWSGELTAIVPMELPRSALRADEVDPPRLPSPTGGTVLLEREALARLPPSRAAIGPGGPLVVHNQTSTRLIVLAQSVPVAFIDARQSLAIDGLVPGHYRMGAIRPLGVLRMPPKLVRIPGELKIGR